MIVLCGPIVEVAEYERGCLWPGVRFWSENVSGFKRFPIRCKESLHFSERKGDGERVIGFDLKRA